MSTQQHRRTRAGGAKKRPTRYTDDAVSAPLRAALNAHKHGRFAEACDRYADSLARDPGSLDAWVNLGAALVQRGHSARAMRAFLQARTRCGDNARALRDVGIGLSSIGYFSEAIDALDASVRADPSQIGAWLALSRACAESGDRPSAERAAVEARDRAIEDPSSWLELHRATFSLDDLPRSHCAARKAFELDPSYAQAAIALAAVDALSDVASTAAASLSAPWQDAISFATERVVRDGARSLATKREGLRFAAQTRTLDGPVVELGVRFGVSTRALAEVCAHVHGFDSFAGLPEAFSAMPPGAFSTDQTQPELPANVTLHVGWFEDTVAPFVATLDRSPSLVHIDSDLYSSAKCALDALGPRIEPGCVLVFDELIGNEDWREQEHRALTEACARWRWNIEWLSISWLTGQAVVRVAR